MKAICIYHGNCADGFTAAWVVRRALGEDVDFVPGVYGVDPPDVTGRDVILVDFSYKRPVLEAMAKTANTLLILDHHKTAAADFEGFGTGVENWNQILPPIGVLFDMKRSGAQIAWDFFFGTGRPLLVDYVGDRDLWQFKMMGSREVAAFIFSYPYDFSNWDLLHQVLINTLDEAIMAGAAIERKHHKDIAELLSVATRPMILGGVKVPVANLPYTMSSDAAHALCNGPDKPPFAACYIDRADARVFSLRSLEDGADVSEIAASYGGGGHAHAAGFQRPIGWEGDDNGE